MIEISDLHRSFDGNEVLKGVSLKIARGEILCLIGGSGCGKSVLLKHVVGLMKPESGRVLIDGENMSTATGSGLRALRSRLGFLFQGGALFDSLSILENVAFPLKEKTKLSEELVHTRALKELDSVGLSGSEHKYPSQLSGGMIKRAALARALVMNPEIMLFDEPTTGLDPVTGHSILKLIDSCHKRFSFTGIIVTHEIPNVFSIVDRVAMLHEGQVLGEGTPPEFMSLENPTIREFVGGYGWEMKKQWGKTDEEI
jgi:phospholipid/cholesterol/gamma-HCH transport system ATP-binding protein